MIHRQPLECDACGTRIVTRTAVGLGTQQVLAFPCPGCGVGITFIMNIDQEAVDLSLDPKPDHAHWVDSEDGATFEATFDVELLK